MFSKRLKSSIRVTADEAKKYYLNNAGQWFRDAVKSEEAGKWIERTIDEGEVIFVVVAYHTLLNARIIEQLQGQSTTGGTLAIPVSTALTAFGVVVPFTNTLDPGFVGLVERWKANKDSLERQASRYMQSNIAKFVRDGSRARKSTR